ncbi:hypothetical protein SISSUDRAFT_1130187 [Sistotremastrum suecicum HHB10207 ss-3]|uniref:Uncharacterized protein n=1 Tax=Sistotremastrum suecicum HHB10207 ss-3 TaxID=1314776 RepID=A0A166BSL1_9AGAM|nr:hypothetical protein SISSUDRAFT_1130187 [Sistotremastrum suecicum HHB10207 ss-3]
MQSPSKRVLTESLSHGFSASPTRSDLTPDLFAALRGVGSRVRKNVTEGYASVTPTPYSSPVKGSTTASPIFRSARDINNDIFGSSDIPRTPSSSPKKRGREEALGGGRGNSQRFSADDDVPTETESDDEDDPIVFVLNPPNLEGRIIKPLRRSLHSSPGHITSGSFGRAAEQGLDSTPEATISTPLHMQDAEMEDISSSF